MRWRTDRRVNGRNAWSAFFPDGEINKLKPKRSPVMLNDPPKMVHRSTKIKNFLLAAIVSLVDIGITMPCLNDAGRTFDGVLLAIVIGSLVAGIMIYLFASKMTDYHTFTKKTRYMDYNKDSNSMVLLNETW